MANGIHTSRTRGGPARGRATFNVSPVKRPAKRPVVYFVAAPNGLIKIGTTGNIEWRLASLNFQSPVPLTLLVTTKGSHMAEREYHRRFASARAHGEWFTRTPEIEAEIARLQGKAA